MEIQDLPKKWREKAQGNAGVLACAGELEAYLKNAVLCYVSPGLEIHFELTVPDDMFDEMTRKPSSCTLSTWGGDTRRAVLVFY